MKRQSKLLTGLIAGALICTASQLHGIQPTPNELRSLVWYMLDHDINNAKNQIVQFMLKYHDINILDDLYENTLLTMLIAHGKFLAKTPDLIDLLVKDFGANFNSKNINGTTPLDVAKSVNDQMIINKLISLGAQ